MNTAGQLLAALYAQNYGYLSAADLTMWMDPQLIISAQNRNPQAVTKAARTAVSLVSSALMNLYDLKPEFSKSDTVVAQVIAQVAAGAISAVLVSYPGSNYIAVPAITITNADGDPGAGAQLTPVISASVIVSIDMIEGGCRYNAAPIVSFEGGAGAGALATAILDKFGSVSKVLLTNGGQGWTGVPDVKFTPVDGAGFGAVASANVQFGKITGVTIDDGGADYAKVPTLLLSGGQTADTRNEKLVMITALNAVRILMGNAASISEKTIADFKMADELLHEISNGTGKGSLPLLSASRKLRSTSSLVTDKFNTRG